jgi:rRNA maturation protein Nop10
MADDPFGAFDFSDSEPASGSEAEVKVPRDFQSEEDYLRQQTEWKPTVHKGEVSPLSSHFSGL